LDPPPPEPAALHRGPGRPFAAFSVLALLVVMFIVEQVAKVGDKASGLLGVDPQTLLALGGMSSVGVRENREWYRLVTAALLHVDVFHLALNGVALVVAGMVIEGLLGAAWFVVLFCAGAIGGSLMGLIVNPANIVSVGASGAIMGLLAAGLVLATRVPDGPARTQLRTQLMQFLVPSLLPLATVRQGGRVDYAAHFGGAIVGALASFALLRLWPRAETRPRLPGLAKGLAVISAACFAGGLVMVGTHYEAYAREAKFLAADLLVDDSKIPGEIEAAKAQVETWGKNHPRDPRVHLYRALRLLDEDKPDAGEAELRAALGEREILDHAFSNGKIETLIRTVLCDVLVDEGRAEDARREANPACHAEDGGAPAGLARLGLCD